jgi:selenocysteine lyase/cysteine desulfurase
VRRALIADLDPAITGWMAFEGTDDFTRLCEYHDRLRSDARRFELATIPYQDIVGLTSSVALLSSLGIPAIQTHLQQIRAPITEWASRRGIPVTSPMGPRGSAIVCVAPPRVVESFRALREARIYASLREGSIRLSPHCYNTVGEMERVAAILDTLY